MHFLKITVDCGKDDDAKWGSVTEHTARNLTYEDLVQFQGELWDGMRAILIGYGEAKIGQPVAKAEAKDEKFAR